MFARKSTFPASPGASEKHKSTKFPSKTIFLFLRRFSKVFLFLPPLCLTFLAKQIIAPLLSHYYPSSSFCCTSSRLFSVVIRVSAQILDWLLVSLHEQYIDLRMSTECIVTAPRLPLFFDAEDGPRTVHYFLRLHN